MHRVSDLLYGYGIAPARHAGSVAFVLGHRGTCSVVHRAAAADDLVVIRSRSGSVVHRAAAADFLEDRLAASLQGQLARLAALQRHRYAVAPGVLGGGSGLIVGRSCSGGVVHRAAAGHHLVVVRSCSGGVVHRAAAGHFLVHRLALALQRQLTGLAALQRHRGGAGSCAPQRRRLRGRRRSLQRQAGRLAALQRDGLQGEYALGVSAPGVAVDRAAVDLQRLGRPVALGDREVPVIGGSVPSGSCSAGRCPVGVNARSVHHRRQDIDVRAAAEVVDVDGLLVVFRPFVCLGEQIGVAACLVLRADCHIIVIAAPCARDR